MYGDQERAVIGVCGRALSKLSDMMADPTDELRGVEPLLRDFARAVRADYPVPDRPPPVERALAGAVREAARELVDATPLWEHRFLLLAYLYRGGHVVPHVHASAPLVAAITRELLVNALTRHVMARLTPAEVGKVIVEGLERQHDGRP